MAPIETRSTHGKREDAAAAPVAAPRDFESDDVSPRTRATVCFDQIREPALLRLLRLSRVRGAPRDVEPRPRRRSAPRPPPPTRPPAPPRAPRRASRATERARARRQRVFATPSPTSLTAHPPTSDGRAPPLPPPPRHRAERRRRRSRTFPKSERARSGRPARARQRCRAPTRRTRMRAIHTGGSRTDLRGENATATTPASPSAFSPRSKRRCTDQRAAAATKAPTAAGSGPYDTHGGGPRARLVRAAGGGRTTRDARSDAAKRERSGAALASASRARRPSPSARATRAPSGCRRRRSRSKRGERRRRGRRRGRRSPPLALCDAGAAQARRCARAARLRRADAHRGHEPGSSRGCARG